MAASSQVEPMVEHVAEQKQPSDVIQECLFTAIELGYNQVVTKIIGDKRSEGILKSKLKPNPVSWYL